MNNMAVSHITNTWLLHVSAGQLTASVRPSVCEWPRRYSVATKGPVLNLVS